eukprot:XP_001703154.1 ERD4-related membrane protein [Chlamydomonas reinhardtii]
MAAMRSPPGPCGRCRRGETGREGRRLPAAVVPARVPPAVPVPAVAVPAVAVPRLGSSCNQPAAAAVGCAPPPPNTERRRDGGGEENGLGRPFPLVSHSAMPLDLKALGVTLGVDVAIAAVALGLLTVLRAVRPTRRFYAPRRPAHIAVPVCVVPGGHTAREHGVTSPSPPVTTPHRLSLANVAPGSALLWAHLVSVYMVTAITLRVLWQQSKEAVALRVLHVTHTPPGGSSHTVLIRDIPGEHKGIVKALS